MSGECKEKPVAANNKFHLITGLETQLIAQCLRHRNAIIAIELHLHAATMPQDDDRGNQSSSASSLTRSCATLGSRSSLSMWLPSSKLSSARNLILAAYLRRMRDATSRWK